MKHAIRQSGNPRSPTGSDKATGKKKRKHHVRKNRNVKQKREYKVQVDKWANRWGERKKSKSQYSQGPSYTRNFPEPLVRRGVVMCAKVRICRRRTSKPKPSGEKAESRGIPKKKGSRVLSCIVRLYKLVSCHRKIAPRRKEERKAVTSSKSCFWSRKMKGRSGFM
jgi:hypothetical protein